MKLLDFELTTPERVAIKLKARSVSVPTISGEITILPDHVPLVAPIRAGELRLIGEAGEETLVAISGGFIVIQPGDRLEILADTAERAEELDLKAIEEAHARAEEALKEKIDDEERQAEATAGLARELARLRVLRKHRSKQGFQHVEKEQG
jgi:F-type H+-transporting ATPase subunit epsilon